MQRSSCGKNIRMKCAGTAPIPRWPRTTLLECSFCVEDGCSGRSHQTSVDHRSRDGSGSPNRTDRRCSPQSFQPYLIADALLSLHLSALPDFEIDCVDINGRVVEF